MKMKQETRYMLEGKKIQNRYCLITLCAVGVWRGQGYARYGEDTQWIVIDKAR